VIYCRAQIGKLDKVAEVDARVNFWAIFLLNFGSLVLPILPSGNNSRRVAVDDEAGESLACWTLGVRVCAREDEVEAGDAAICDPASIM